ncbi:TetR/AcrR family transcriptional regulator [Kineobactrum salinum]|uniref:TetR family transcriptional regulator n=1 Tax=Kineobactrum salinum TaxID=2708301 RepID=A0A6C0U1R6_9GAMM|nr:TetR family transcriptional regulator [Kineobactrum salinum]QIB66072.1 TetR family transcriptional regulator [Kineobactrum salinum]
MPKRSKEYMAARRNHILDAALQCYIDHGFDKMSLAEICATAGISMGAFYKHFRTKHEVILALADRSLSEQQLVFFPGLAAFRDYLVEIFLEFDTRRRCDAARADLQLINLSFHDDSLRERARKSLEQGEAHLYEAMKDLRQRGEIRADYDVRNGARILHLLLSGLVLTKVIDPSWSAGDAVPIVQAEIARMAPEGSGLS